MDGCVASRVGGEERRSGHLQSLAPSRVLLLESRSSIITSAIVEGVLFWLEVLALLVYLNTQNPSKSGWKVYAGVNIGTNADKQTVKISRKRHREF